MNQARIGRAFAAAIVGGVVVVAGMAAGMVAFAGCHTPLPKYDYAQEPDPNKGEITLGVGDTVAINVWENANLNTEATIRADGKITMPLIGDIRAVGETPTSLKESIKAQVQKFVKLPTGNEVTVAIRSWKSYRFTIQGEVGHPGVFTYEKYVTVSEALALAGGLTKFANRSGVQLTRTDPKTGQARHIPFDYDLIASGKRPDMDIYVLPGDAIWVP